MFKGIKIAYSIISAVFCAALMIILPSSCSIDEDLPHCPRGLDLHFVFDHHLEGWSADAPGSNSLHELPNVFNPQVHCYTLNVYNEDGELVKRFIEPGERIRSNHYHLKIDLPHGTYHIRAYGGTGCDERSFLPYQLTDGSLAPLVADEAHNVANLHWQLNYDKSTMTSDKLLHDYYYAYGIDNEPLAETDIVVEGEMYKPHTLRFMRNTNAIRVMMQHTMSVTDENGKPKETFLPVTADDYNLVIVDNNTLFNHANQRVLTGEASRDVVTYRPWTTGSATIERRTSTDEDPVVATADFSVSRLFADTQGRLQIYHKLDGQLLLDMPLSYLQLSKPAQLKNMSAQEYLDRQKYWNVTFIRHSDKVWADATIIINGWTVRINDVDF